MSQPTLVILAAGMGSRFGGLKQVTKVDDFGHAIIDFSLFDAYRAGFRKVCFIIKHEIEEEFKARIGSRMEQYFDVTYVYQQLDRLPDGYEVPASRVKPWGTGHAVACCAGVIDGPFAVINADDYYGAGAFSAIYDYLSSGIAPNEHAMVAYRLRNTVTENGHVARGICTVRNGLLTDVVERTRIVKDGSDARYSEDGGETWTPVTGDAQVSMNFWGFGTGMLDELVRRFPAWLDANLPVNPEKCEYFLPFVVNDTIQEGLGTVRVLDCTETWHGVTYKEDLPDVVNYISQLRTEGVYPDKLLD